MHPAIENDEPLKKAYCKIINTLTPRYHKHNGYVAIQ